MSLEIVLLDAIRYFLTRKGPGFRSTRSRRVMEADSGEFETPQLVAWVILPYAADALQSWLCSLSVCFPSFRLPVLSGIVRLNTLDLSYYPHHDRTTSLFLGECC